MNNIFVFLFPYLFLGFLWSCFIAFVFSSSMVSLPRIGAIDYTIVSRRKIVCLAYFVISWGIIDLHALLLETLSNKGHTLYQSARTRCGIDGIPTTPREYRPHILRPDYGPSADNTVMYILLSILLALWQVFVLLIVVRL